MTHPHRTASAQVSEFHSRRRVEFSDTDMGGMMHFSRFFVFAENAEHELLRSLGASVDFDLDGQRAGWPRVASSCEFHGPARFEDELDICLRILRKGRTSLTYGFEIRRGEDLLARGQTRAVCCLLDLPEGLRAVPIPSWIADQLEEAAP